jgi:hypothetical protein
MPSAWFNGSPRERALDTPTVLGRSFRASNVDASFAAEPASASALSFSSCSAGDAACDEKVNNKASAPTALVTTDFMGTVLLA